MKPIRRLDQRSAELQTTWRTDCGNEKGGNQSRSANPRFQPWCNNNVLSMRLYRLCMMIKTISIPSTWGRNVSVNKQIDLSFSSTPPLRVITAYDPTSSDTLSGKRSCPTHAGKLSSQGPLEDTAWDINVRISKPAGETQRDRTNALYKVLGLPPSSVDDRRQPFAKPWRVFSTISDAALYSWYR